jgi:hypothetical protein
MTAIVAALEVPIKKKTLAKGEVVTARTAQGRPVTGDDCM